MDGRRKFGTAMPSDPDHLSGLAIDIGGTKTAGARLEAGAITKRVHHDTDGSLDVARWLSAIAEILEQLDDTGAEPIGVAVTGRVDRRGRWSAVNRDTLSAVVDAPLLDDLRRRFGPRVSVMNDAAASALGEAAFGAGRGVSAMGFLTVSTGVGGGFVFDGRPLTSQDGLAGHVGFMTSRHSDASCPSGRVGTLESVASGKAIADAARAMRTDDVDAREVFDCWRRGEDWAAAIVQRSAAAIAEACASLKSVLGLDLMVIGGSVGMAPGYIPLVRDALEQEPPLFRVKLRPAALGPDSPLFGALHAANEAASASDT